MAALILTDRMQTMCEWCRLRRHGMPTGACNTWFVSRVVDVLGLQSPGTMHGACATRSDTPPSLWGK